jgi:hypothetical protein
MIHLLATSAPDRHGQQAQHVQPVELCAGRWRPDAHDVLPTARVTMAGVSSPAVHDRPWGTVRRTFENMERAAPAGFSPRVDVILDDGETFAPAGVQEIGSWLFFEATEGDDESERHRVIVVRPEMIARVEIRFVRTDAAFGFRLDAPDMVQPHDA